MHVQSPSRYTIGGFLTMLALLVLPIPIASILTRLFPQLLTMFEDHIQSPNIFMVRWESPSWCPCVQTLVSSTIGASRFFCICHLSFCFFSRFGFTFVSPFFWMGPSRLSFSPSFSVQVSWVRVESRRFPFLVNLLRLSPFTQFFFYFSISLISFFLQAKWGIEPTLTTLEIVVLPLNYSPGSPFSLLSICSARCHPCQVIWQGHGFYRNWHKSMVHSTNFWALSIEDSWSCHKSWRLVQSPWACINFTPNDGTVHECKTSGCCNDSSDMGIDWSYQSVIHFQQSQLSSCQFIIWQHIRIKSSSFFVVPYYILSIHTDSIPLVSHHFHGQRWIDSFIHWIQQRKWRNRNSAKILAGIKVHTTSITVPCTTWLSVLDWLFR